MTTILKILNPKDPTKNSWMRLEQITGEENYIITRIIQNASITTHNPVGGTSH